MTWRIDGHTNDGYPFNAENAVFPQTVGSPKAYGTMKIDGVTNDGYPFSLALFPRPAVVERPQRKHLIRIYDKAETIFESNGVCIIEPTSCVINEALNGEFEAQMEILVDDSGDWMTVSSLSILKIPIKYRDRYKEQLFRVYRVATMMGTDGSKRRVVYARHIFYDLNDAMLIDVRPTSKTGQGALDWILNGEYKYDSEVPLVSEQFTAFSDIETEATAYYQGETVTGAILGADNSFLNRWGGELYRDNFYFSVCEKKEDSLSDCFDIEYGVDMTDVEEDIDYSEYASLLVAESNLFPPIVMKHYSQDVAKPHYTTRYAKFNYESATIEQYQKDVNDYFKSLYTPCVSYRVSFAEIANLEEYKDFIGLQNREIGDTGRIRNRTVGIETVQRIVKRTYDYTADKVTSVELGNIRGSFTRKKAYSNTVSSGLTISDKLAKSAESQLIGLNIANLQTIQIWKLQESTISAMQGG